MLFEFVYKTMIIITDINNVLHKLNVLSSKENKKKY